MRNKFFCILLFCLCFKGEVFSQLVDSAGSPRKFKPTSPSWIYVVRSNDGEVWSVKGEYVYKIGDEVKIWAKCVGGSYKEGKINYTKVTEKQLLLIRCNSKQYRMVSTVVYSSTGKIIVNEPFPYSEFEDVIPDSIIEEILKTVCLKFN